MPPDREVPFCSEDLDTLQELMNIAFGRAGADLADVLDMSVMLQVPDVQVVPAVLLRHYIGAELQGQSRVNVVAQEFRGDFQGTAFLILPLAASTSLVALAQHLREGDAPRGGEGSGSTSGLEGDALAEMGNILIGACVGKLADLLQTAVAFAPPSVNVDAMLSSAIDPESRGSGYSVVVLRTVFGFGDRSASGFLFLAISRESVKWLEAALRRFLSQYE